MAKGIGSGTFTPSSWSPGFYDSYDRSDRTGSHGRDKPQRYVRSPSEECAVDEPLLDPMQIPWYHPHTTRNLAEAELQKAEEGVYLMRPRLERDSKSFKGFAIDVRATHTVKHFLVNVTPEGPWTFGQETFTSIPDFLEHFDNKPLLGDEGGRLIVLKYAYPREIEENPDYHSSVTTHFLAHPPKEQKRHVKRCQSDTDLLSNSSGELSSCSSVDNSTAVTKDIPSIHSVSLASKAGYLVKMGAKVKSWKKRWFILKDRHLSYYTKDRDTRPLRVIDLSEAVSVSFSEESSEKPNMFKIVLPWRTFYLQADNEKLRKEWVELLTWRLQEIKKLPKENLRSP